MNSNDTARRIPIHMNSDELYTNENDKRPKDNKFLKVKGWCSSYRSVNNLLLHLMRKSKSEGSRRLYLWHLFKFCQYSHRKPNELVALRRSQVEKLIQEYADSLMEASPRYSNLAVAILKGFFAANGFKRAKALELETYHAPPRFRITPEYIPTKSEVYRMADSACSLRDRAIILTLFSSGVRNSTLRALRYGDIADELKNNCVNVMVPVYPEMKKLAPNACKGRIPYYVFTSDEATQAIKLYVQEREEKYSGIDESEPLFCTEYNQIAKSSRRRSPLSSRYLEMIVKSAAKKAGISQWKAVHPHCLRKAFESVLHNQLIDGSNLDVKTQEFFMGHVLSGSQDPYFDRSKVEHMRIQYSKLRFGRTTIENRFKVLRAALTRAFEDTDVDPEQVMEEYVKLKHSQCTPTN
jgi:integrase